MLFKLCLALRQVVNRVVEGCTAALQTADTVRVRENILMLDGRVRLCVRFRQESVCGVVFLPRGSNPFVERFQAADAVDGEAFDDRQPTQLLLGDD